MPRKFLVTAPASAALALLGLTRARQATAWRRAMPAAVALAMAAAGASSALGEDAPTLDCTMTFQLKGWSAIYERADGHGTVSCADGSSMPVVIRARGAGLTLGKSRIDSGTGKFAYVHAISDVLGSYAQGSVHAGAVKSGTAELLTNGKVSLALAGNGKGYDLGIGVADFTIRRAKEPR